MANGIADDFITTTLLAIDTPKFVVPAMNEKMLLNNATKRNMQTLINDGVKIMSPDTGMLAEGYTGKGRLPKEEEIIEWIINKINSKKDLVGKKSLFLLEVQSNQLILSGIYLTIRVEKWATL